MPDNVLVVENDGPEILATNYWELPAAAAGKFLVSVNAGAFRLLLPPSLARLETVSDMASAEGVAISRGPWPAADQADAFEIVFDDRTSEPFVLYTSAAAFDRLPVDADAAREWLLSVWVAGPLRLFERPCRYRRSRRLPDLRRWDD
jgi:hypothetical protein